MEIVRNYSLYLNSRQADIKNINNYTFILNPAITLTNKKNRFVICAEMIEVPYSFSQINDNYNRLDYSFTDGTGTVNSTLIFPEGNYNINNLITTFITLLINDITIYRPAINLTTSNFSIYYNPSTSKVTFNIINKTLSVTLKFSTNEILGICFGFPQINQTFSNVIILNSVNKVNVNPITSIYLRSENIKFSTSYEAVVQPYAISDIVAKVPVETLPNSIIYFRGNQKQMVNNTDFSALNFYWSDNLSPSYELDLNGLNFGIYLTISEVMIKDTNEFQDRIGDGVANPPNELLQKRDQLLLDLLEHKKKLETEIEEAKNKKIEKEKKSS
jgi:hypothetical protein